MFGGNGEGGKGVLDALSGPVFAGRWESGRVHGPIASNARRKNDRSPL